MIEAFPLYWPDGRVRTPNYKRERAKFDATFARARDNAMLEVKRLLGGTYQVDRANVVLSTNIALRRDGLPLANQRQPEDPGVALYFDYKGKQVCFACDRWHKVEENMQAIAKTIDALRGIERWGTGDMVEAAFRGYTALPSAVQAKTWREVMGYVPGERPDAESLRARYRKLAMDRHPDRGGSNDKMAELNSAYEQAQKELK